MNGASIALPPASLGLSSTEGGFLEDDCFFLLATDPA